MTNKSPLLVVLLGLIPGLGHFYCGQRRKGVMIFGAVVGSFILYFFLAFLLYTHAPKSTAQLFTGLLSYVPWLIYGWSLADAYNTAKGDETSPNVIKL